MTGTPFEKLDEISKNSWLLDFKIVHAEALLSRSLIQLTLGSYIKGAFNLRKAFKLFEAIQKEAKEKPVNEEIEDIIKYNLGLFYFMVRMKFQFLINLM